MSLTISARALAALRFVGFLIAWAVVMLLGALLLGAGVYGLNRAETDYRSTIGQVESTHSKVVRGNPDTTNRNRWSVSIRVSYLYRVDGVEYRGQDELDRGFAGSPSVAEQISRQAVGEFAPGASIDVHVDSENPARSVLDPPRAVAAIPALAFGLLFSATGAVLGWRSVAGWWRQRAAVDEASADSSVDRWLSRVAAAFLAIICAAALVALGQSRSTQLLLLLALLALIPALYLAITRLRGRAGDG